MKGLQTWNTFKYVWEKEQFNGSNPVSRERKSEYSPEISRKLFTLTEVVYRGANWCKITLSLGTVWISVTWGPGSVTLKLGFIPGKVAKMGNLSFHSLGKKPVCVWWQQQISERKHLFSFPSSKPRRKKTHTKISKENHPPKHLCLIPFKTYKVSCFDVCQAPSQPPPLRWRMRELIHFDPLAASPVCLFKADLLIISNAAADAFLFCLARVGAGIRSLGSVLLSYSLSAPALRFPSWPAL